MVSKCIVENGPNSSELVRHTEYSPALRINGKSVSLHDVIAELNAKHKDTS